MFNKSKRYIAMALTMILLSALILPVSVQAKKTKATWPKGPKASKLACESAIVMELSSGLVLYEYNSDVKHYPASITKLLTALLCLENSSLSEVVTFSEDAVYGIEADSSNQGIDIGEQLTMEQCLYCILLESANEACLGVAEHISGTTKNFIKLMNERVASLGLSNTHFSNPNGLHNDNHYTTAYDMAVIAREAMKNSTFRKITASKTNQIPKTNKSREIRYLRNHHQMVNGYDHPEYEYNYCIGGKTGYTQKAQATLVTFAEKDGMELVCVVMKSVTAEMNPSMNEYTDTLQLLNFGFENYQKYEIVSDNQIAEGDNPLFTTYSPFFNPDATNLHLTGGASVVLPAGTSLEEATQEITYNDNITLAPGDNVIGTASYTYDGKIVGSTDIIYTLSEESDTPFLDSAGSVDELVKELNQEKAQRAKKEKEKFSLSKIFTKKVLIVLGCILGTALVVGLGILLYRRRRKGVRYHWRHRKTFETFNHRNHKNLRF